MAADDDPNQPAITFEQFAELKKAERARLAAMPPDEAQAEVDTVLQPRLWRIADRGQLGWPAGLAGQHDGGIEPMSGLAPEDLVSVLRLLAASGWDAVLVGGQAVNVWAGQYVQDAPAWRDLRPFTSVDLDYYGGLAEARLAMRVLHARGRLNTNFEPGPNAGVLQVPLTGGRELLVDILTGVYGVSAAELEQTAVTWSGAGTLSGVTLRVIHPLLLLEGKSASLRGLPQGGRQDAKHLRILLLVVAAWLRQRLGESRLVFDAVERIAACAASPDGLHAFAQGIDLLQALPLDEMQPIDRFAPFFARRLPQLLESLATRRQRHLDALGEPEGPAT